MKTFTPKPADLSHEWYVIDATDVVLGRLASQTANLLRGKNKPSFAPYADQGNHVIIINADKIALSGNKLGKNLYQHSGFPARIIRTAVKGMLPKNRLAKVQLNRLHVYTGSEHPHVAQQPTVFEIKQISQQAK